MALSGLGCGTTSRSNGGAAGLSDATDDSAKPLPACPPSAVGFPLRERQRGVPGCPSDIETRPGDYPGYQVLFGCLDRGDSDSLVIVRGLGGKSFRQLIGSTPSEEDDAETRAWNRLADNLGKTVGVRSIHRSSRIHACRSTGYAIELRIHNFHDVDDAVRALGDWLARMDSSGEIVLLIEPKRDPAEPL